MKLTILTIIFIITAFHSSWAAECRYKTKGIIDFRTFYADRNNRTIKSGHSLWGGAPDTPDDSPTDVMERLLETTADYEDCLHEPPNPYPFNRK